MELNESDLIIAVVVGCFLQMMILEKFQGFEPSIFQTKQSIKNDKQNNLRNHNNQFQLSHPPGSVAPTTTCCTNAHVVPLGLVDASSCGPPAALVSPATSGILSVVPTVAASPCTASANLI